MAPQIYLHPWVVSCGSGASPPAPAPSRAPAASSPPGSSRPSAGSGPAAGVNRGSPPHHWSRPPPRVGPGWAPVDPARPPLPRLEETPSDSQKPEGFTPIWRFPQKSEGIHPNLRGPQILRNSSKFEGFPEILRNSPQVAGS